MKASFVIPAYNVAPYVKDTLRCLASQTIQDFEVVIVDDGSTDGTLELIDTLLHDETSGLKLKGRVRIEKATTNSGGPYQPRKRAIELARAPLVAPLDADDRIGPHYLENLLKRMEDTDADMVYPAMYIYDGKESRKILPSEDFEANRVWRGRDIVKDTLGGWKFGAGGGLIKRELYMRCFEKYDSTVAYTFADEVLTRQLLVEAPKVTFSEEPYHYRVNPESATRKISEPRFMLTRSHRALVDLARDEFGEESPTMLEAEKQLFHGFFDTVRLYSLAKQSGQLDKRLKETALRELKETWSRINWKRIKRHVSPRYYLLGRLGITASLKILPVYDKIKG